MSQGSKVSSCLKNILNWPIINGYLPTYKESVHGDKKPDESLVDEKKEICPHKNVLNHMNVCYSVL